MALEQQRRTAHQAGEVIILPNRFLRGWSKGLGPIHPGAPRGGRIGPSGRPVADRTVEYDLKFLIAVLNWAEKSRDERGRLLLDRNPLRGLRTPSEKNPTRVVLAEEEYRALLKVSGWVDLAVPRRARTRARDGPPDRSHPPASVG